MIKPFAITVLRRFGRRRAAMSWALVATCLAASPASAATYTWTNGSGNSTWDTTLLNWTQGAGDVAWASGNDAVFGSTGVGTVTLASTQTITSATFAASGYTITGGTLTLGSATTSIGVVMASHTATISSLIAGSNLLQKTGTGTLVLSNSNSFSGGLRLAGGVLAVGNDNAVGSGLLDFNGTSIAATFRSTDATDRTITNAINLGASCTFGSATTGNLLFTGSVNPGSGGKTWTVSNSVTEFSGRIGGNNKQIKSGSGTLVFSGEVALNAVSATNGILQIDAGILRIAPSGYFTLSTPAVVINGSTAEFNYNSSTTLLRPITFTQGTLSGTGKIGTAVTVGANNTLSPGNSPGSQSFTAGLTWAQGGTYKWEINDAASTAGTGWDLLNVSGSALNIAATSGTTFTIAITSLSGTAAGNAAGFSATKAGSWTILSSSNGITGFSADKFTLNRSAFSNTASGSFTLAQVTAGANETLVLAYNTRSTLTSSTTSISGFRVMQNQATTTAVNVINSGPDATDYALSSAALSLSSTAGTLSSSGTAGVTIGYASTATTGARTATITLTNAGNANNSPSTINVSGAVVANRVVTASPIDFGVVRLGTSGTATSTFTSTGADDQFTRITVGNGSGGGFTVSGSSDFVFNGSGGSSRSVAGSFVTAGAVSGSVTLTNTSAESGGSLTGQTPGTTNVSYSASVFDGNGTWNVNGGGAWGSQASSNWTSTGGVNAAPGTFTGFTNTDTATFGRMLASGIGAVTLDGAQVSLASLTFSNTTGRYVISQGSGGSLTLSSTAGAPSVSVVGTHEIATGIAGNNGLRKLGAGTLVLNAANSYTGDTTVQAGTLIAQTNAPNNAAGAFGNATSAIVVGDASTAAGDVTGLLAGPGVTIGRSINVNNQGAGTTLGAAGTSGTATFSGAISLNNAVTLQAATGGTVDFTGAWTTNNNGITVGSVGNAGTVRLSSALGSTGPLTLNAGTLDLNGRSQAVGGFTGGLGTTVTSAAAAELTVAPAADSAFSGVFTGAVGLRKQGLAALELSGVSTNTGNTIIEAGTLVVGVDNAISGSSAITIGSAGSRGTLAVNHNLAISSLTFSGSGGDLTGGGIVTLANAATGTATITVNEGTNFFHANATLGSDTVVNVASGASFEFHNALSGSLSLTKSGAGVLNVNGDNDQFSGNFFITDGRVNILAGMNQIGTGTTTLSGGATINLNGQSFGDRIVVVNGTILNAGGTATTTNVSGSSTFSGTTQGTVNINPGGYAQFSGALGSGTAPAYVTVSGSGQATFAGIVSGSASVTVNNGGSATFNNTVSGQVISHGVSTFKGSLLSGGEAQVQTGGSALFEQATENGSTVSVQQNALAEFRGTMAGTATVTGSAIFTSASGLTGSLTTNAGGVATLDNVAAEVTGEIHNDGQLVVNRDSGSQTISGRIRGSGAFLKQGAGLLVLTGSNDYSGGTTVDSGTLSAASGNAFGTGAITLGSGATLDLADLVVSNTIAGNGGTIRGGSIMGLLSGSATLSGGQTTFKAGIAAGARIGVAATGTATFGDGASVDAGATVVNDGMVRINRSTNTAWQLAAPITGTGGLRVDGGYVQLSGSNTYSGLTQISGSGAILAVNGSVAGKVQVDANAALGGSGVIAGNIGGSGLIGPGNSPGILTVQGQVEPTATTSFAFEFMQTGDPIWSTSTASKNDVLQLTNVVPFASSLQESNIVNIYFEVASLAKDDTFRGGFFSNYASGTLNFASAIGSPTYQYYVLGSGSGTHDYNGKKYYTFDEYKTANAGLGITRVTASVVTSGTANFSSGTIYNGQVTQFVIIPEPDTIIFAGIGIAMAGWSLWKRRRIAHILRHHRPTP